MRSDLVTFRRELGLAWLHLLPRPMVELPIMPSVSKHFWIKIQTTIPLIPYPKHPISSQATTSAPFPSPLPRAGWQGWWGHRQHADECCCCPSNSMRTEATYHSRKRNQPLLIASGFQANLKGHASTFIGSFPLRPKYKHTDHKKCCLYWVLHSKAYRGIWYKRFPANKSDCFDFQWAKSIIHR